MWCLAEGPRTRILFLNGSTNGDGWKRNKTILCKVCNKQLKLECEKYESQISRRDETEAQGAISL